MSLHFVIYRSLHLTQMPFDLFRSSLNLISAKNLFSLETLSIGEHHGSALDFSQCRTVPFGCQVLSWLISRTGPYSFLVISSAKHTGSQIKMDFERKQNVLNDCKI